MNTPHRDDVLRRLAAADPAAVRPLTPAEAARSEEGLRRLLASDPVPAARRDPVGRTRRRVVQVVAAVVAAVSTGFLVVGPASAQDVLREAAANAGRQPVAEGAYWYIRTEVDDPQTVPYQREVWRSEERMVLRDEQSAAFRAWEAGRPAVDPSDVRVEEVLDEDAAVPGFGDGVRLTWAELAAMPTDAATLKGALRADVPPSGHGAAWDLWRQSVSLLEASPASPALRRALWQVVADIPGVRLLGSEQDGAGRVGTAVEADFTGDDLERYVLVLEPESGALLETRIFDADGTELYRATLLEEGARDTVPALGAAG